MQKLGRWQEGFVPSETKGIILAGPVGVGKTFLMASLARGFAEKGVSVKFTDFFQLLGELRAGFSEGKSDTETLAPLIDVDVLVIDELGKGRNKDFDKTVLDQLVCGRYNQNKTIVASTNYTLLQQSRGHVYNVDLDQQGYPTSDFNPDQFGTLETRIGSRIFSRLKEMTYFVELKGNDLRSNALS